MNKVVTYSCEYCGKEFYSEEECEEHEKTHIIDYKDKSNEEIAELLSDLSDMAYDYHIGGQTMGMPIRNFKSLMDTAAARIRSCDD